MIQLIQRPEYKDDDLGIVSYWQSNRLPYIFKLQRKDVAVTQVTNYNGTALIQSTDPIGFDNGYNIILYTDNNVYKGKTGSITYVYNLGGYYYARTTITYIGNAGGGYYNTARKENYRATMRVVGFSHVTNSVTDLGTLYATPDSSGLITFDVRGLLSYAMNKINLFTYDTVNAKDIYSSIYFKVYYNAIFNIGLNAYSELPTEVVDGNPQPLTYYAIDGVKQILSDYGQNFIDYLPTPDEREVKFLTEFVTPTYFIGFPFSVSWIFNIELAVNKNNITLEEDEFNIVGTNTNHYDEIINKSGNYNAVNYLVPTGNYTAGTEYIELWLEANGTAGTYYVAENYVADDYTTDVTSGSTPAIRITEKKKIFINADCRKNPVYLMWRNSLGGWDYWLFDNMSETSITSKHNGEYSVYIENIETANLKTKLLTTEQRNTITVGDSVTLDDLNGIRGIEKSSQVYMLYDVDKLSTEPLRAWLGVNILPKGFKFMSGANYIDIEVTFELPDLYTIPN